MALLLQLVRGDRIAKLNEVQVSVLISQLEGELLTNDVVKRELTGKANEFMKALGQGGKKAS